MSLKQTVTVGLEKRGTSRRKNKERNKKKKNIYKLVIVINEQRNCLVSPRAALRFNDGV